MVKRHHRSATWIANLEKQLHRVMKKSLLVERMTNPQNWWWMWMWCSVLIQIGKAWGCYKRCKIPPIAVIVAPWIYRAIHRLWHGFISMGPNSASRGQCMVAWSKVTHLLELGGLGVSDLTTLGYVLQLRWEWILITNPSRMWLSIPSKSEPIVCAMFQVSTTVQVGNKTWSLFWSDRWLDSYSIE
jgi:hypothetical protein